MQYEPAELALGAFSAVATLRGAPERIRAALSTLVWLGDDTTTTGADGLLRAGSLEIAAVDERESEDATARHTVLETLAQRDGFFAILEFGVLREWVRLVSGRFVTTESVFMGSDVRRARVLRNLTLSCESVTWKQTSRSFQRRILRIATDFWRSRSSCARWRSWRTTRPRSPSKRQSL